MFWWYVLVRSRTVPVRSTLTFPWFNDNVVRSGTFCLTVAQILLFLCLSINFLKRPFRHPVARAPLLYVPMRSAVRSGTFHDGISTSGACWPGLAPKPKGSWLPDSHRLWYNPGYQALLGQTLVTRICPQIEAILAIHCKFAWTALRSNAFFPALHLMTWCVWYVLVRSMQPFHAFWKLLFHLPQVSTGHLTFQYVLPCFLLHGFVLAVRSDTFWLRSGTLFPVIH